MKPRLLFLVLLFVVGLSFLAARDPFRREDVIIANCGGDVLKKKILLNGSEERLVELKPGAAIVFSRSGHPSLQLQFHSRFGISRATGNFVCAQIINPQVAKLAVFPSSGEFRKTAGYETVALAITQRDLKTIDIY